MLNLVLAILLSQEVSVEAFEKLHTLIRPAEKEAPWAEIPWMTSPGSVPRGKGSLS
jgi:hypothetical protein